LDQFSRNIFRDDPQSFLHDRSGGSFTCHLCTVSLESFTSRP
jgi:uncharacterized protein (DUF924 family)